MKSAAAMEWEREVNVETERQIREFGLTPWQATLQAVADVCADQAQQLGIERVA